MTIVIVLVWNIRLGMEVKQNIVPLLFFILLGVSSCSAEHNVQSDVNNQIEGPNQVQHEVDVNNVETPQTKLIENLRPGAIEKFITENGNELEGLESDDRLFFSMEENSTVVVPDLNVGNQITVIALCEEPEAHFFLLKDGEDYAEGPCGGGLIVSYRLPAFNEADKPKLSFSITGSKHYDVAFFQRKENINNEIRTNGNWISFPNNVRKGESPPRLRYKEIFKWGQEIHNRAS